MTIPFFSTQQNAVFVPALLALLVATLAICLPIVFAQALRKHGRMRGVVLGSGALAAGALVAGAVLGGMGVRTLQEERGRLQAEVQTRYGLQLTEGEADTLIDGDDVPRALPELALRLGLEDPQDEQPLALEPAEEAGRYDLTLGGRVVQPS